MKTIQKLMSKKETIEQENARKKQASEFLKNADRYYKAADIPSALSEVEKTLAIDPGNFYARAYKERLLHAQQHPEQAVREEKKAEKAPARSTEQSRREEETKLREAEEERLEHDEFRQKLLAQQKKIEDGNNRTVEEHKQQEQELRRRAVELEIRHKREEEGRIKSEDARRKLEGDLQRNELET